MDFDQLETFNEVSRSLSFSRAAEKRFRTQPAISSQIRALEEEVGAKLFDRSGGKVSLTTAGKTFQKYVEDALLSRRNVITAMAELERIPRGELVVAANEGTSLHILPEVFAEFKRQYANVAVSIMRSEHAKILEYVIDNTIDFGVVSLPVNDNRMQSVVIHRDDIVVIAAPSHPAATLKQPRLADLAEYPVVMPKLGRTRDALENAFHAHNLKVNVTMELDSSELLKRFVAASVGIGFIARSNAVEDVKAGVLHSASVADLSIRRDLALLFRKDKALSRAALAFIDIAVKIKNPQPLAAEAKH